MKMYEVEVGLNSDGDVLITQDPFGGGDGSVIVLHRDQIPVFINWIKKVSQVEHIE